MRAVAHRFAAQDRVYSDIIRRDVVSNEIPDSVFDAVLLRDLYDHLALMLTGMLVVHPSKSEQLVDAFPCGADPVPIDRQDSCAIWRRPHIEGKVDVALGETYLMLHALLVLNIFVHDPRPQGRRRSR